MALKGDRNRQMEETKRQKQFLEDEERISSFLRIAFLIIHEMVKLTVEHRSMLLDEVQLTVEHPTVLLDEILHSIFFLGKLYNPEFSPESIVINEDDVDMLKDLRASFPRPFALYSSHLPKRSPFSCVLDMIVGLSGQTDDEKEIIERLQDFIKKLEPGETKALVSSTICVSQSNIPKSVKYYGVSMSTSGRKPGKIMVAASCLNNWNSKVADAVMTYYPKKTKKPYFDGTIKLPQHVRCQAYDICPIKEKPPCKSCGNLFGLGTSEKKEWAYGNCAEAESLSNLLKDVEKVREQVQPTSGMCTDTNRERVKKNVLKELKSLLRELKFEWDNEEFYNPRV